MENKPSLTIHILQDASFIPGPVQEGYLPMLDLLQKMSLVHENLDKIKPKEFVGLAKKLMLEANLLVRPLGEY